jgi:UDP-N-acetylmuramoylalanine--D-glutamate ligase
MKALVVGLERSGLASLELLKGRACSTPTFWGGGALALKATDSRPLSEMPKAAELLRCLDVPFELQSPAVFEGCDLAVLSPGVPADLPEIEAARRRGVEVIGEVELAARFLKGKIIGITGSNGKTTTTAMVGHILRETGIPAQVGGNIGTAVTALVDTSREDQWNVLELSSFQLETIANFHAHVGVCLNVTPDHLDRHHTLQKYAAAKGRLFETQREEDYAVLNADDAICVAYSAATRSRPLWFSLTRAITPGIWLDQGRLWFDDELLMPAAEIPIRGRHNVENTMAAAAAARLAGAGLAGIAAAVRSFRAVEHRLEFVRTARGVHFYNDSKATNVDATLKALDAFDGGLWVILGGKDKGSDYTLLADSLRKKARSVLLIGAAAPKIAEQLKNGVTLVHAGTLETAVKQAYAQASPGDTVLLAPACASFDQFQNYEHRGRVFKQVVEELGE